LLYYYLNALFQKIFNALIVKSKLINIKLLYLNNVTRGMSVSIETRLRAGRPVFNFLQGQWWNIICSPPGLDQLWDQLSLLPKEGRSLLCRE